MLSLLTVGVATATGRRVAAGTRLGILAGTVATAILAAGCGEVRADNTALLDANRAARAAEVTAAGKVVALRPDATGADGVHERFTIDVAGLSVEIDHNLTLAPRVPVRPGDAVLVHGQFEPDPGRPLIHYTHHATGRHEGGWIELSGRRYQ